MSHLAMQHIFGAGLRDRREIQVPVTAQQWFAAKVSSELPAGANNKTVQNLLPLLLSIAGKYWPELIKLAGSKEAVIAIVQKAYMDHIAPIDIPYIPNMIEPVVDNAVAYLIGVVLSAVIDNLPMPAPAPTPSPTPANNIGSSGPS